MVFWFENIDQAQAWFVSDVNFKTIQIFIDDDFQQKTISAVGDRFQQTRQFAKLTDVWKAILSS